MRNRNIVEHPATLEVRLFGLSKMKTVKAILSHLKLLLRITRERSGTASTADETSRADANRYASNVTAQSEDPGTSGIE